MSVPPPTLSVPNPEFERAVDQRAHKMCPPPGSTSGRTEIQSTPGYNWFAIRAKAKRQLLDEWRWQQERMVP